MIKIIIFLLSIFGFHGAYFYDFDFIVCDSDRICFHEEGHKLDAQLGFPSQSVEFKEAVNEFPVLSELKNTCFFNGDFCYYSEAYANLYGAVHGNITKMPENFRKFYPVNLFHIHNRNEA